MHPFSRVRSSARHDEFRNNLDGARALYRPELQLTQLKGVETAKLLPGSNQEAHRRVGRHSMRGYADIAAPENDVRFTLQSGHRGPPNQCPQSATS